VAEATGRTVCAEPTCRTVIPDRVGGKTFFIHCDEHRYTHTPVAVGGKRGAWKRVACTACGTVVEKYATALRGTDRPFCSSVCRNKLGAKPRGIQPRQCDWCKETYRPKSKTKASRFCCRECMDEWKATQPRTRNRPEKNSAADLAEVRICPEPGCEALLPPRNPTNGYRVKWCPQHRNRGRGGAPRNPNKMITLTCFACGQEFERYKSAVRYNSTNRYFCSKECRNEIGVKPREVRYYTCDQCGRIFEGRRGGMNRFCDAACMNEWQRREQTERTCPMCEKVFKKPQGDPDIYCSRGCWTASRETPRGKRKQNPDGYILVYEPDHAEAHASGWVLEHRKVMSDLLGRALLPGEEVHHRFERYDNRPEALELWDKSHPAGQRVSERYRFYKEWCERVERERPLLEAAGVTFHDETED
jgi:endogenous inhibitor of DNA gyrase (YacG/DUF329 family)